MVRDPWDLRASERAALHPYTPSHPAFIDITDLDTVVELDDQPQVVDLTEEDGNGGGVNVGASGSGVGRAGSAGRGGRGHGGRDGGDGRGGSAQGGSGQGEGPGGGASAV